MRENLYAIDKKGKIRIFFGGITQAGETSWVVITYTGLLDGKNTISKEVVSKGKQGRNIEQQAIFQLDSAYNEKYDEGYKSFNDLKSRYPFGSPESPKAVQYLYKTYNIRYNTNKNWYPLPMLAERYDKHKSKVQFPVYIQPKLNGVRCIALYKNGNVLLCSRGGSYYEVQHIKDRLFNSIFKVFPDVVLDGEIYKHNVPLQTISGAVRKEKLDMFNTEQSFLEYHVYDLAIPDKTFDQRFDTFVHIFQDNPIKGIIPVKTNSAASHEEVERWHNQYVSDGYEGAILRDPHATYEFGFRDLALIKVKHYQDGEFNIVGCDTDEQRNPESFVFILRNDLNDLTFKARPTGSIGMKVRWMNDIDNIIGKKATVRFQERSLEGLPIQGHVRHKDSDCLEIEAIRDYE